MKFYEDCMDALSRFSTIFTSEGQRLNLPVYFHANISPSEKGQL